ncbi:alpha-amlyase [Robertmurraya yapensis]|uniref:alpha-amylase n=1 Tax=Bacillus yapensis TaxID=2492960 RepID=A0A431W880_9BACI|nr:alpha-amylase family glycosyl hydrolase [Bacillus yapensis]RTR31498.1 alpha-amlyase [Bacillus yapensis]TKS95722.1 alpha-amlyase [Bacillus yapensis]
MKKRLLFILIPLLLFYGLPSEAAEKEVRTWQDETIYYINIDRFNNNDFSIDQDVEANDPNKYHGGDFQGIIDRLDYIKDMGFTTISLSSIFDNEDDGYHGNWTKDFQAIEEHFGSLEKFKELVTEAHKKDMKVLVDFNANHVGPNHPWLKDAEKKDWFHPEQNTNLETSWVEGLPDLAQENPDVQNYLIDTAKYWIEETDIDGYRLENVEYVPVAFWQEFTSSLKQVKKDFYLLGDLRSENESIISKYEDAGMDVFFNYSINKELRAAFVQPDQPLSIDHSRPVAGFMDNNHMHRFTRDSIEINQHPGPRWRLALTYLYTTPGVPFVFYGSEIALDGGEEPDNLRQMDFRTDKELIEFITSIASVRQQLPSLRKGEMEVLYAKDGMTVYKREHNGEISVVAINNTTKSQSVTISSSELEDDKELRGLLNDDMVRSENGEYHIILDREEAEIYLLAEKTGLNIPFIVATAGVVVLFIGFLFLLKRKARK